MPTTSHRSHAPAGPSALRVLCVDDNRDQADSEAMLLEAFGYDTRACYDGTAALRVANDFRPRVCLLDLNMPGMDGDELAGKLRSWAGGCPLLLVAVTAMGDDASRGRTAGFDHHFVKPVEPRLLLDVLNRLSDPERASGARTPG